MAKFKPLYSAKCHFMALMIDRPVIDGPNFIKSCFSAEIVVSSCSKLFSVIKQMLTSTMELCM